MLLHVIVVKYDREVLSVCGQLQKLYIACAGFLLALGLTPAPAHAQPVADSQGQFEYRVAEIYISYDSASKREKYQSANAIVDALRKGGSFPSLARQFSDASTSALGGDLGWVQPEQLPAEISMVATRLPVGGLAGPIDMGNGFSIIAVFDKRGQSAIAEFTRLSLKQLEVDPDTIGPDEFTKAAARIRSCQQADKWAETVGAKVVNNSSVPMYALPLPLQEQISDLPIGFATVPYGSLETNLRILIVCSRNGVTSQADAPSATNGAAIPDTLGPRLALLVGNTIYQDGNSLQNPANDVELIANLLRQRGFSVQLVTDASKAEMDAAVRRFSTRLSRAGSEAVGLFYYAGHGVQSQGENFLIPVDARLVREADLDRQAISAQAVLNQMNRSNVSTSIMILDACRNLPWTYSTRVGRNGLAQMTAPNGSLIAFSTGPGLTAADGSGRYSPYAEALAKYLEAPNVPIEQMFKQVRKDVFADTKGKQLPWESTSLLDHFYFNLAVPAQ